MSKEQLPTRKLIASTKDTIGGKPVVDVRFFESDGSPRFGLSEPAERERAFDKELEENLQILKDGVVRLIPDIIDPWLDNTAHESAYVITKSVRKGIPVYIKTDRARIANSLINTGFSPEEKKLVTVEMTINGWEDGSDGKSTAMERLLAVNIIAHEGYKTVVDMMDVRDFGQAECVYGALHRLVGVFRMGITDEFISSDYDQFRLVNFCNNLIDVATAWHLLPEKLREPLAVVEMDESILLLLAKEEHLALLLEGLRDVQKRGLLVGAEEFAEKYNFDISQY